MCHEVVKLQYPFEEALKLFLRKGFDNTTVSEITEAVDVSALSDKDKWDVATVDDTYYDIDAGENLKIVTASGALSLVYVELMRVE